MPSEYILQEDGASRLTLEDGTGFVLLESSDGAVVGEIRFVAPPGFRRSGANG